MVFLVGRAPARQPAAQAEGEATALVSISPQTSHLVRAQKEPNRGRSSQRWLPRSAVLPGSRAPKPVPNDLLFFCML